jgi:ubiquinol-cytochrome c reductase cytochrome c1 subunit
MLGDVTAFWKGQGHAPKGGFIAMAPQLAPDKVTFDDGTKSTIAQQAKDVAAFMAWVSEPKLEERKAFGVGAMIYLVILSGLLYVSYRRIWRNVAH